MTSLTDNRRAMCRADKHQAFTGSPNPHAMALPDFSSIPLPPAYIERIDGEGRAFYVNKLTTTESRLHPGKLKALQDVGVVPSPGDCLPDFIRNVESSDPAAFWAAVKADADAGCPFRETAPSFSETAAGIPKMSIVHMVCCPHGCSRRRPSRRLGPGRRLSRIGSTIGLASCAPTRSISGRCCRRTYFPTGIPLLQDHRHTFPPCLWPDQATSLLASAIVTLILTSWLRKGVFFLGRQTLYGSAAAAFALKSAVSSGNVPIASCTSSLVPARPHGREKLLF